MGVTQFLEFLLTNLVHVKQYVMGELKPSNTGFVYNKTVYSPDTLDEYFDQPFEIEAYGTREGISIYFLGKMERDRKRNGNDDMSIYEMLRAIGQPVDLLGYPL